MPYFRANGLDIFYEVHGQGDPMLLIHGVTGTGQTHWEHQIPVFSERFQLIVPDLRGHGRTGHPETINGPSFFELATSDLVALVSSLNLGPAHVCGFSMGSSLASGFVLSVPWLAKSLIIVSGAARVNHDIGEGLFDLWEKLGDLSSVSPRWAKKLTRLHGEQHWPVLLQNYSAVVIARFNQDEDIVYRRASDITCPTLIVQGGKDLINPPLLSEELLAGIPDSEMVVLDCEHWAQGLLPQEFNKAILDFLDRRFPLESSCGHGEGVRRMDGTSRLLVATRNPGKVREYEQLLTGLPLSLTYLDEEGISHEVEEIGETFAENAIRKAQEYARLSGLLTLADDSGLEVDALGGEPGVHSARYGGRGGDDEDRYQLLLQSMQGVPWEERGARFRCVIAVAEPGGESYTADGTCEGVIAFEPQGEYGFGYDPIFYLPEYDKTMAQLSPELKNRISHRARAAQEIRGILERILRR
jgi:XTP/dITP diphosphohydrolase